MRWTTATVLRQWAAAATLPCAALALFAAVLAADALAQPRAPEFKPPPRNWQPLAKDGLHDPRSPAVRLKQQPGDALSTLAPDTAGNQVRWVEALDKGQINPRATLNPGGKVRVLDSDILLNVNGGTPMVRFPHRQHTLWLDCSNCHNEIFIDEAGANQLSMERILQGEQCGICHGAVSFPLTECNRCHSVPRNSPTRRPE